MTVKGGCQQLTGMVSLGHFHGAMENIKSGKNITMLLIKNTRSLRPLMLYYPHIRYYYIIRYICYYLYIHILNILL